MEYPKILIQLDSDAQPSVFDAVVLHPLPYAEPERLMVIWRDLVKRDIQGYPAAPADLADYRQATSFAGIAGIVSGAGVGTLVFGIR